MIDWNGTRTLGSGLGMTMGVWWTWVWMGLPVSGVVGWGVHTILLGIGSWLALLLARNVIFVCLLLPSTFVSSLRPDIYAQLRTQALENEPTRWKRVAFPSAVDGVVASNDGEENEGGDEGKGEGGGGDGKTASSLLAEAARAVVSVVLPPRRGPILDGAVYVRNPVQEGGEGEEPSAASGSARETRWLVWLNANGVCYEEVMEEIASAWGGVANILLFNYRGVGLSEGNPRVGDDLVDDGIGAVEYLRREYGADPDKVLIYGHSMGGGAGSIARTHYPNGPLVVDRSFASLTVTVGPHLIGFMAYVVGLAIGLFAAPLLASFSVSHTSPGWIYHAVVVVVWSVLVWFGAGLVMRYQFQVSDESLPGWVAKARAQGRARSLVLGFGYAPIVVVLCFMVFGRSVGSFSWPISALLHIFQISLGTIPVGLALAHFGGVAFLGPILIKALGWDMDAASAWPKVTGNKLLFYHDQDEMVDFEAASLYAGLAKAHPESFDPSQHAVKGLLVTRLQPGPFFHMYAVNKDPNFTHYLSRVVSLYQ